MIDCAAVMRAALLLNVALVALVTDADGVVHINCPDLPQGYDPTADGAVQAVTFFSRGGTTHSESNVLRPSFQITVWGSTSVAARAAYGAVWDALQGKTQLNMPGVGYVISALEQVSGQDITDPDTGWSTVVSFWELAMRSN